MLLRCGKNLGHHPIGLHCVNDANSFCGSFLVRYTLHIEFTVHLMCMHVSERRRVTLRFSFFSFALVVVGERFEVPIEGGVPSLQQAGGRQGVENHCTLA